MLVDMNSTLVWAEERGCAVAAFDTPNLEILLAVTDAAERRGEPVIIQHAQVHEGVTPLEVIGPIMVQRARASSVPVCVMLDHAVDIPYIRQALDIGFSAIMYDGSKDSYADNVRVTREVVRLCKDHAADVEAEIGVTYGHEGTFDPTGAGSAEETSSYTDPDEAARFVKATGIDALAASFGTVHGFYKAEPKLDFDRIVATRAKCGIPLVMHGGSGLSRADTRHAITCGIRKINYFSYMSHAGVEGVRELLDSREVRYFHEIAAAATEAMRIDALSAMDTFSMC